MAASSATTQAAKLIWKMLVSGKRFERVLQNVNITSAGAGRCSCEMTVAEEHANRRGTMHGGFVSTLVDTLTTVAVISSPVGLPGVSVDLSVSFLKGAKIGEKLTMDAEVIKAGQTLAYTKADLFNANGDIIAQGRHIKHVARRSEEDDFLQG